MDIIKTYNNLKDDNDNIIGNRKVLTVNLENIDSEGNFGNYTVSTVSFTTNPSVVLIVDGYITDQLDKTSLKIIDGKYELILKDGEKFTYPIETEKEKQIRELKEQLAALESSQNQGE